VAERSGWKVVRVYEDAGISGAKGRDKRPGLDSMMKVVNPKEFDMVAAWSVVVRVRALKEEGLGPSAIAKTLGIGRGVRLSSTRRANGRGVTQSASLQRLVILFAEGDAIKLVEHRLEFSYISRGTENL